MRTKPSDDLAAATAVLMTLAGACATPAIFAMALAMHYKAPLAAVAAVGAGCWAVALVLIVCASLLLAIVTRKTTERPIVVRGRE